ncbi:MAG: sulfite exporter TauE/SafE family protein [Candidatus Aenigmarchaeota archaeon]|nr:sulfite exporter TauE/SafE family protein [Candidatus Aenigmarchaeota archaeon]
MEILIQIITTFLIGVFASFIGAIAGGGGLISIPFLIFLGLPPQAAIATNKLGGAGLSLGAAAKFWKEKKIIWKAVMPLCLIGIIGAYLGANILLNIDPAILSKMIGFMLLILLPLTLLKKDIGLKRKDTRPVDKGMGYVLFFFLMIFGGFFGGGAGTLMFYILMYFFGFTIIQSNATSIIPWFVMSITSLIIFIINGLVVYQVGISLFAGMLVGGYLGAQTAIKKGNRWVKIIFLAVVFVSAVKILFF